MAKKKHRKAPRFSRTEKDVHHIFFQNRHWKMPWERKLRSHEYCKVKIPRDTLHHIIHDYLVEVPAPGDEACKTAYEAIENWLEAGYIHLNDSFDKRLEILKKCFSANNPATAEALETQRQIVLAFYAKPP
uniref:Uncharacterized protein n=1 Tax=Siphoviridae sp. ct1SN28 TaxID=2825308 RepID=A0A8S5TRJ1_9CAUD|nr:MAG TPA: hypothetical protein [Siphoviridae sp. ct1SN28]